MKKLIIPFITNVLVLAIIPLFFEGLDAETAKKASVGMLVLGNSLYFFIQGRFFSKKHSNILALFALDILSIIIYMYVAFFKVEILFLGFYTVMIFLGVRAGTNYKKYNLKNQEKEEI